MTVHEKARPEQFDDPMRFFVNMPPTISGKHGRKIDLAPWIGQTGGPARSRQIMALLVPIQGSIGEFLAADRG